MIALILIFLLMYSTVFYLIYEYWWKPRQHMKKRMAQWAYRGRKFKKNGRLYTWTGKYGERNGKEVRVFKTS